MAFCVICITIFDIVLVLDVYICWLFGIVGFPKRPCLEENDAEMQLNDQNELLRRKVDNGFHDVTVHPVIPLCHFSSNMDAE